MNLCLRGLVPKLHVVSISRPNIKMPITHDSIDFSKLALQHTILGRYNVNQLMRVRAIQEEWHHLDIRTLLDRGVVA